ncbi:hypothetical protein JW707_03400 [Candidatus Woesearchaeota archaeon]|nr:hypothetical protein [Candidatus Woesearchaeota archaeon]
MKIRIDMHVHPNLPKSEEKAVLKANEWWKALKKKNIRCIISAEHSYKDFRRNFEIMEQTAPKGFVVFPGAELITKEGVDIVAFYKDISIYKEKRMLTPYLMSTETMVSYLNRKKYAYFISHPFTLGTTSIIKNLGMKKAREIMKKSRSVEVHNASFSAVANLLERTMLSKIFRGKYEKMRKVESLPKEFWEKIKFISGGSDAHEPEDIGSFLAVEAKSLSPLGLYSAITTNKKDCFFANNKFLISSAFLSLANTFREWLAKKAYKLVH